ncbi:MAG: recombinase family protein [Nocardioides sp.]
MADGQRAGLRVAVYARISLDRVGSGLGVERQLEDCRQLARERGWEVVAVFSDNDVSAFSGKVRPGYRELLEFIRAEQADVVLAWHVDRLHRSPVELEEYIGVSDATSTITVTVRAGDLDLSTAAGRMVARMLGAAARHESEQKSERIRRKRRQEAESGQAHGPLGYGYDEAQAVVEAEAAVVREVATRILDGDTLYGIASELNVRGVLTPGAGRWYHHQVRRLVMPEGADDPLSSLAGALLEGVGGSEALDAVVDGVDLVTADPSIQAQSRMALASALGSGSPLAAGQVAKLFNDAGVRAPGTTWRAANLRAMIRRGTLCGWREFGPGGRGGGELTAPGAWPAILTVEETKRIRLILDAPDRKRSGRERRLLLSSILRCGRCGAPMGGYNSTSDGPRYACSSQPGLDRCGRLTVVAEPVDELVTKAVMAVLSDAEFRRNRVERAASERVAAAEDDIDAARRLRDEYARDAAAGMISRGEWFTLRDGLAEREQAAQRVLGRAHARRSSSLQSVPNDPDELAAWWEASELKRKREVLKVLIERVVVNPVGKSIRRFDPSRIEAPVWRF